METVKIKTGIFRNLTFRWMLVMCAVIIPVNILTAVITGVVSSTYQEQMRTSYENQLNMYTESVSSEFDSMQNKILNFLSEENLNILTMGGDSDTAVVMTRMKQQIGDRGIWSSLPGLCYIWSPGDDIASFLPQKKSYTSKQLQQVREYLMEEETEDGIHVNQSYRMIHEMSFLLQEYHFQKYSVGLMYDTDGILRKFHDSCGEVKGSIYLADGEGNFLSGIGVDGVFAEESGKTVDAYRQQGDILVLCREMGFADYQMVWVLDRADAFAQLPQLVYILWVLTVVSFIALPLLGIFATRMVIQPLKRLVEGMQQAEKGNFTYHVAEQTGTYQMDFMCYVFNHMVDQIHLLISESYEKEIEKLQADSINMQLQVNQHMLLNFLNTIYSLSSAGKQQQVNEFTLLLMKYFRYVLRRDVDLVPVQEEIQFVKDYLRIQQIRFPNRFVSVYAVSEEAEGILIPQLLVENFVENAIKYGLNPEGEIEILINIRCERQRLCISICDTGNGMPDEVTEKLNRGEIIEDRIGKHIGIWNCRRRLRLYYGNDYEMRITSHVQEGTQVWIQVPMEPMTKDEAVRGQEM